MVLPSTNVPRGLFRVGQKHDTRARANRNEQRVQIVAEISEQALRSPSSRLTAVALPTGTPQTRAANTPPKSLGEEPERRPIPQECRSEPAAQK